MNYITLNNGTKIPAAGIGTFMMEPADAEAASFSAIQQGYEMIDTANAYMNEKAVGRAVKASGKAREELYISTKLWPSVYKTATKAIDSTLARLDTDYIDLLFLHQPVGDYVGAYMAMEQAVKDGKVKSLGLSNFSKEQVEEIIEKCEIRPAVLQVEAHPYYPQNELKEAFPDIHLMAWYPLGHGDKALQEEAIFATLAEKYNKSTAQIILRWHTQVGNIVIPGSKNPAHIKDNIDIFDITLTDEELNEIAKLNNGNAYYKATKAALLGYLAYRPNFDKQD
ncbi:MAG: aldo/keto reductase [Eubacterium sp.]|nr:aldo/keto reductase [Eubacterium sp.]